MIQATKADIRRINDEIMGGERSPTPWLPWVKDRVGTYAIMGQDGGLIAEFHDSFGRGKGNRDLCLKAIAYVIKHGIDLSDVEIPEPYEGLSED